MAKRGTNPSAILELPPVADARGRGTPNPMGDVLATLATLRGLSNRQLCIRADVPLDAVRNIRVGRSLRPRASTVEPLARVLGVTADELYAAEDGDASVVERVRAEVAAAPPVDEKPPRRTSADASTSTGGIWERLRLDGPRPPDPLAGIVSGVAVVPAVTIEPDVRQYAEVAVPAALLSAHSTPFGRLVMATVPDNRLADEGYAEGDYIYIDTAVRRVGTAGIYLLSYFGVVALYHVENQSYPKPGEVYDLRAQADLMEHEVTVLGRVAWVLKKVAW